MLTRISPRQSAQHRPRVRRKSERPGELLSAALALFLEQGFAATRVEDVARRAGVSKGTLFVYFESKQVLLKAVVRANIGVHIQQWQAEFAQDQRSSVEALRQGLWDWWQRIGSGSAGGIAKLMLTEANQFPELASFYQQEVVRPGLNLIKEVLQRGIERGELRPMDVSHNAYLLMAALMYLSLTRHAPGLLPGGDEQLDPERYLKAYFDLLVNGLLRPGGSKPKEAAQP